MNYSLIPFSLLVRSAALACLAVALLGASTTALGQAKPKEQPKTKEEEDKDKIPDPENITVETKDGVPIKATYYASKLKKKAVPIIMLHGWEGNRGEFHVMASHLQKQGYAVICPDLRGHGHSLKYKTAGGAEDFELEKMKSDLLEKMVYDVEATKQFVEQAAIDTRELQRCLQLKQTAARDRKMLVALDKVISKEFAKSCWVVQR